MESQSGKKYTMIGFAWAGWIFDFFDLILYSFLLIGIQKEFGLSDTNVALVYSASLAITAVGGIIIGMLGDKLGRRMAIIYSVLIFTIGTLLSGFAWSLWSLLLFRLITGFGIGGEWAAGHTLINESLTKGERGKASSIIQSGAPVGAALASVVGGFITPVIGWRLSFILASAPSLLLVILMYLYLPESPQFLIFKAESMDEHEKEIPIGISYVRASTKRTFGHLSGVKRNLFLGTILSLWGMLGYWVIFSWAPKALEAMSYSQQAVGWWMILSQVGAFIGYLSFGYIAEKIGHFRITFAMFAVTFGVGVFIFSTASGLGLTIIGLLGIFITGLGTGFFSGYGPLYARLFPVKIRNTSASWCFNVGRLGAFVAPILVSSLASSAGYAIALGSGVIFASLTASWVFLLPSEKSHSLVESFERESEQIHLEKLLISTIET